MGNTVNVNINATDNGTLDATSKKAEKLSGKLKQAESDALKLGRATGGVAAAKRAKEASDESFEYRQARGARGTGAEGRDFAKQAQGLGGLVHVYATYAANLFAVTAGFLALSKAADYTNMVKGLEQLGAASGRNLGYMSKQVVALTDNAVSLKEAMTSVAQASSAGLTGEQIERLSSVAKNASIALGRDMADSLNRLTRGITKIEPELLDELGIFVRVDKAASDYARTIGKTALSLTEYERRQAFAIASLEQAEKKFGEINIDSNPYNQLQASFINILYSGGELINKVLGPIAKLLSSSPTALTAVMVGLGAILTKQAIPALTQWRTGLRAAAEEAKNKALKLNESIRDSKIGQQVAEMDAYKAKAQAYRKQALDLVTSEKLFSNKAGITQALKDPMADVGKNIPAVKSKITGLNSEIDKLRKAQQLASASELKENNAAIASLEKKKAVYLSLISIIQAEIGAKELEAAVDKKTDMPTWEEKIAQRRADKATRYAGAKHIGAQAVSNAQSYGISYAFNQIDKDIAEHNKSVESAKARIGSLGAAYIKTAGTLRILATTAMSVISAFSEVLLIFAAVSAALSLLNDWMTTNKKEQEAFSKALDRVKSNAELVQGVLEDIAKKDYLEQLSAETLLQRANALKEVSDSASGLLYAFEKMEKSQSSWSKGVDWISNLWGGSNKQKLSEGLESAIESALDSLGAGSASDKARNKLAQALGLDSVLSNKEMAKAASKLSKEGQKNLIKELKEVGDSTARTANNISSAMGTLDEAVKNYDNTVNSLNPNDTLSRMALDSAKGFLQLSESVRDTEDSLAALVTLTKDFSKLKLMPTDQARSINNLRMDFDDFDSKQIEVLRKEEQRLRELAKTVERDETRGDWTGEASSSITNRANLLKANAASIEQAFASKINTQLQEAFKISAAKAVDILSIGLSNAAAKAGIIIARSILEGIDTPGAIKLEAEYKNKEIDIGLKTIESQARLVISQDNLRLVLAEDVALRRKDKLQSISADKRTGEESAELARLDVELAQIKSAQNLINKVLGTGNKLNLAGITEEDAKSNPQTLGTFAVTNEVRAKQLEAAAQKTANNNKAEVDANRSKIKLLSDIIRANKEIQSAELKILDKDIAATEVFDEKLNMQRLATADKARELQLKEMDLKILGEVEEYSIKMRQAAGNERIKEQVFLDYKRKESGLLAEREKTVADQKVERANELVKIEEKRLQATKHQLALMEKIAEIEEFSVTAGRASGRLVESQAVNQRAALEKEKIDRDTKLKIAEAQAKAAALEGSSQSLATEVQQIKQLAELDKARVDAYAQYNAELVKTEEILRKIEKSGEFSVDYFGKGLQDFSNKISEYVATAKSAVNTFNEGLISAIDSSIDKFFDMMQKSELNMKDMVTYFRNAVSDVFRDTASQMLKNTWKDALKGILPESSQDRADKDLQSTLERLKASIGDKTSPVSELSMTISANIPALTSAITTNIPALTSALNAKSGVGSGIGEDTANILDKAASVQKKGSEEVKQAGVSLIDASTGMDGAAQQQLAASKGLETAVAGFGNGVSMLLMGLAAGGSGASSGKSVGLAIAGMVLKAGISYLTGGMSAPGGAVTSPVADPYAGMTMTELSAKGNVYTGSQSLSRYSNSVVSSPTYFAFANGGIPSRGLMGEAGPEAIMPLQRDSAGRLGVSGTSGMSNTFEININIDKSGNTSESTSGTGFGSDQAKQLGQVIKAVVTQELVNQSRPGGLLAR